MLNLSTIMLFSENPAELSKFYQKVLMAEPAWQDADYYGFKIGNTMLIIGPHSKVKGKNMAPERMFFNIETDDIEQEFNRIKETEAKVIQPLYKPEEEDAMSIATFADPDGNFFQIVTPVEM